jgi:tellurite resistance protein TehA-like permease
MATLTALLPSARPARPGRLRLDPGRVGPNWYAAVMGTAIVANGAVALPLQVPGRIVFATAAWGLAAAALVALAGGRGLRVLRHRGAGRAGLGDPAAAVFFGCPPMALLAVGYATLAVGARVIGRGPAVAVDLLLWTAGTLYAVTVAAGVPYLMITRHGAVARRADPTWLLPVVAPMVAASTGPALLPHLPAAWHAVLLYGCGALFGASLLGVLAVLPVVFAGLLQGGSSAPALTPTLFLVLGPLGQSTTAAGAIADGATAAGLAPAGPAATLAVLYGVVVTGFALLWLLVACAANLRALRAGMPFAMTWWAFTFPVGTLVTGAASLARHTGLGVFADLSAGLYLLLLGAWSAAASGTVRGLLGGHLP